MVKTLKLGGTMRIVSFKKPDRPTVVRFLCGDELWFGGEAGWYFGLEDEDGGMLDTVGPYATVDECLADIPEGTTATVKEN